MSWMKIKALNEQRDEKLAECRSILAAAEARGEDLTADESKRFDALAKEADALKTQRENAERIYRFGEDTRDASRHPVTMQPIGDQRSDTRGEVDDDTNETRALRADESCASFIETRGMARNDPAFPGLSFGAFCRSAIAGPRNETERRALSTLSNGAGLYTTNASLVAPFIDKLRAATVCMKAGARIVPMNSDKTYIARVATDPTPEWVADLDDVAASDPAFDRVELLTKELVIRVNVSRALIMDSVNVESALTQAMVQTAAIAIDQAALFGASGGDNPVGIFNTSGINSVSMGTNGDNLDSYSKILDALYEIQVNNGGDPTALTAHPRTMLAIAKLADTTGQPLQRPDAIKLLPFLPTTSFSITQTQGEATNASSAIIGDFRRLIIGMRLDPRIE